MFEEKLKEIGLTEKEASVFLCILQYQKISPARVASLTKINRPTVYSVAKELIAKGLISEDEAGKAKYFVSLGEEAIGNLVKRDERVLEDKKQKLPDLINILRELPKQGKYSVPKIRFVDESNLRNFLIEQSLSWAQSTLERDGAWWGFQDHTLLESYEDWADYFWTHFSHDIQLNLLTNEESVETEVMSKKSYARQRHIKYWNGSSEFSASHVVVGDYILMIMTREHPHYLIEIHDRVMAENLRQVFRLIWTTL